jgi:hypothetical protein
MWIVAQEGENAKSSAIFCLIQVALGVLEAAQAFVGGAALV